MTSNEHESPLPSPPHASPPADAAFASCPRPHDSSSHPRAHRPQCARVSEVSERLDSPAANSLRPTHVSQIPGFLEFMDCPIQSGLLPATITRSGERLYGSEAFTHTQSNPENVSTHDSNSDSEAEWSQADALKLSGRANTQAMRNGISSMISGLMCIIMHFT